MVFRLGPRPLYLLAPVLMLWCLPAKAQQSLGAYLSSTARGEIARQNAGRKVNSALRKLERSPLPRPLLAKLMGSDKAAPFLPRALPQLASLSRAHGIEDVVKRLTRGGQSGAYELAVAHAFKKEIKSVSTFVGGNEVDGLLRSGTIIESKSGRPRRPEHILVQAKRRAQDGSKVLLALNYKPRPRILKKLQKLNRELHGRLEVQYLPLNGSSYKVLVNGRNVEDPSNRRNQTRTKQARPKTPRAPRNLGKANTRPATRRAGRWGHWFRKNAKRPISNR